MELRLPLTSRVGLTFSVDVYSRNTKLASFYFSALILFKLALPSIT